MKLSVAGIALALLCGCASTPVMQPQVNQPATQATPPELPKQSATPCMDSLQEAAAAVLNAVQAEYRDANDSETVKDAKEAAKKASQELYEKATEYYEEATE